MLLIRDSRIDGFQFLEHTADLKYRAFGGTPGECFINSARALFTAIINPVSVGNDVEKEIDLGVETLPMLLHDYLSEPLFLFETEHLVFSRFSVHIE